MASEHCPLFGQTHSNRKTLVGPNSKDVPIYLHFEQEGCAFNAS